MLMLTHTWILREFLGEEFIRRSSLFDLYIYNILPDVLPLHESLSAQDTHRADRKTNPPAQFRKARYIHFHLLVDDFAHFGEGERRPGSFDPDSRGYAYMTGKEIHGPLRELYGRSGQEISAAESAYRAHVFIEMAFDLALYESDRRLMEILTESMKFTLEKRIAEISRTAGWFYGLEKDVVEETLNRAAFLGNPERLRKTMNVEGRTFLFQKKFNDTGGGDHKSGLESLFRRCMGLTENKEAFLQDIKGMLDRSGFNAGL